MSYKVQYLQGNSNMWVNAGSFSTEYSAIQQGKTVSSRSNVKSVRVLGPNGSAVWFG
jgi:hypothetical protein